MIATPANNVWHCLSTKHLQAMSATRRDWRRDADALGLDDDQVAFVEAHEEVTPDALAELEERWGLVHPRDRLAPIPPNRRATDEHRRAIADQVASVTASMTLIDKTTTVVPAVNLHVDDAGVWHTGPHGAQVFTPFEMVVSIE